MNANYNLKENDNGSNQDNPSAISMKFNEKNIKNDSIENSIKENVKKYKDLAFKQYALHSRVLMLPNDDYPISLIEKASKSELNTYNKFIVKTKDKTFKWDDLLASDFKVLHYRVLFEVLKRTNFETPRRNYELIFLYRKR